MESIRSILEQSFTDFELVVIDDGSVDGTVQIVKSFIDPRIRLVICESNSGIAAATNRGYALARGEYIAQMDHDDVACPNRLAMQIEFLDANPNIDGCGSQFLNIGHDKILKFKIKRKEKQSIEIGADRVACETLFTGILFNPTVMFRSGILNKFDNPYDSSFKICCDKDFIERSVTHGVRWVILPHVLVHYRRHAKSASRSNNSLKMAEKTTLAQRAALRLIPDASEEELHIHALIANRDNSLGVQHATAIKAWFTRLLEANRQAQRYPEPTMRSVLVKNWLRACALAGGTSLRQGLTLYHSIPELVSSRGVYSFLYEWQKRTVRRWKNQLRGVQT